MGFGKGEFRLPKDVAVDEEGNIYVLDTQNDRVQKFDNQGNFILEFGKHGRSKGEFMNPTGIFVKDRIYITDTYNDRIQVFVLNGDYLFEFGGKGSSQGLFNHPGNIAISSFLFVTDMHNHRVQKFDLNGNFLSSFGRYGDEAGEFDQPTGIDVMGNKIVIADRQNHRVQVVNFDGNPVLIIGGEGKEDGKFDRPWDCAFDKDSSIYVVDCNNNRVQKFDKFGNRLLTIYGAPDSLKLPCGCCMKDALYIADTHNHRVVKFSCWFSLHAEKLSSILNKTSDLSIAFPNPSRDKVKIFFELPHENVNLSSSKFSKHVVQNYDYGAYNVSIKIYDVMGRLIKTVYEGVLPSGKYVFTWDRSDKSGREVSPGVYFYILRINDKCESKKIVIVK